MEIKTSELTGSALDWAVARAIGEQVELYCGCVCLMGARDENGEPPVYEPSTDWSQGGRIIELMGTLANHGKHWSAHYGSNPTRHAKGETALIAACRAIVAAKIGDTVTVPDELEAQ